MDAGFFAGKPFDEPPMSRFGNLEFKPEFDGEAEVRPALKDEAYYLNEARDAVIGNRFEQALRSFSKVLEFNPQNASAWTGQVRMLIELGEFHEAKVWADKALERFPKEPELLAAKGVALGRSGDLNEAIAFSDASIEERGDTPYIWLARGDVLLARKERRADYCFDKAIALAGADWTVRWFVSRIYHFYRQFSIALKFAQDALGLDSTRAAIWLQLGQCQMALGLAVAARNSLMQAQQLDPQCHEATKSLESVGQLGFFSRMRGAWRQLFNPS